MTAWFAFSFMDDHDLELDALHEEKMELRRDSKTLRRLIELNIEERLYGVETLCRNGEWWRVENCIAEIRSDIAGLKLLADRDEANTQAVGSRDSQPTPTDKTP